MTPLESTTDRRSSMRVVVTGHNGYIGSVMVSLLRAPGHELAGLDTFYFEDCVLGEETGRIPVIRRDIRDVTVEDLIGFDAVVHLAALCNDPLGDLNADWTFDINPRASVHLARVAKEAGIHRFLYASSCSMYGAAGGDDILTEKAPLRAMTPDPGSKGRPEERGGASGDNILTDKAPLRPITPYAVSKVRTEEDVSKLADASFSPIFMRNATAYGLSPRLRADVVLNNLVCWAHTTGRIRIMSDGPRGRPLVHIQDISRAFAVALVAPRSAIHNEAFNVGSNEENYQVSELAEIVRSTVRAYTGD